MPRRFAHIHKIINNTCNSVKLSECPVSVITVIISIYLVFTSIDDWIWVYHLLKTMLFTSNEDKLLVNLVRDQPALYQLSHNKYKNSAYKDQLWNNIATSLDKSSK